MPPYTETWNLYEAMAKTKEILGYEGFAYWEYFVKETAPSEITAKVSLVS